MKVKTDIKAGNPAAIHAAIHHAQAHRDHPTHRVRPVRHG